MRNPIIVSVIINRPPSIVFAALTDFNTWSRWGGGNLDSVQQVSTDPLQVGSQIRQINRTNRKLTETLVQVTHFVPDQTLGIQSPTLRGVFTVEPVELGTQLNARFEVESAGLVALMYSAFLRQFVRNDLHKFKAMVEANELLHKTF